MLNKICALCKESLPKNLFTSNRAKYCRKCLVIHKLEKRGEMLQRSIDRTRSSKQKTKGIIRTSDLKKEVQKVVNKYIRLRDAKSLCISCQKKPIEHAGHYISQGSSGALRYEVDNLHGQCSACNVWLHGHLLEYRIHLVEKIGSDRVEWLEEHRRDIKKWTREELERVMVYFKKMVMDLL